VSALIAADLLKLRRRRGLWLTTLFLPSAFVTLITVLAVSGVIDDADGGATFVEDFSVAMNTFCVVLTVLVGARLGSDERAAGTLRYQLLTGTPRHRLYLSKVAALVVTCLALTLISVTAITIGSLLVPLNGGEATDLRDVINATWNVFLPALCYGSIAFGVGALVGSTGPAIATALVLNLVGINVLYALTLIDDSFRHLVLNLGVDRLTIDDVGDDDRVAFGAAIAMVVAWVGGFLGAGWLRLRRIEA
jgi:ABC-type transport system involved in multi-copper enzyme maturation permease subunit